MIRQHQYLPVPGQAGSLFVGGEHGRTGSSVRWLWSIGQQWGL